MALTGRDLNKAVGLALQLRKYGEVGGLVDVAPKYFADYSGSLDKCRRAESMMLGFYLVDAYTQWLGAMRPASGRESRVSFCTYASATDRCRAILLTLEAAK